MKFKIIPLNEKICFSGAGDVENVVFVGVGVNGDGCCQTLTHNIYILVSCKIMNRHEQIGYSHETVSTPAGELTLAHLELFKWCAGIYVCVGVCNFTIGVSIKIDVDPGLITLSGCQLVVIPLSLFRKEPLSNKNFLLAIAMYFFHFRCNQR